MKKVIYSIFLMVMLAVIAMTLLCGCEKEPAKRGTLGSNDLQSNETATPDANTFIVAAITGADIAENKLYVQVYNVVFHDEEQRDKGYVYGNVKEFVKSGELISYTVNDDTLFMLGDIFNYDGLSGFDNTELPFEAFAQNAVKKFPDGSPLYFRINHSGDTLTSAILWVDYYQQG